MDISQVSFVHGEVSPILAGRTDQEFYASGVQALQNFFVRAEGGISNRPGTQFVGACSSNVPNGSYLLPFIYSNQQTYVVEVGAGTTRLFSQGAFIQNISSPVTITGGTFTPAGPGLWQLVYNAVNTFAAGQTVTVTGVVATGVISGNGTFVIAAATGTTFTLQFAGASLSFNYVSGGTATVPLAITNPYTLADLPNLRWAQSADTLNVAVSTQPLYQLKRITATSFTFTAPQLLFGPFQDLNTDGVTYVYTVGAAAGGQYSLSGTSGSVDIFASGPIFQASHVGALFQIKEQFPASIPQWEAQKQLTAGSTSPVGIFMRSNGNIYKCVAYNVAVAATNIYTGTRQPVHTQGTLWDGNGAILASVGGIGVAWQFVCSNTGVALITQFISSTHVKGVVQSYKGQRSTFSPTVVGGPTSVAGPFTFTGDGTTTAFTSVGWTGSVSDPNQYFVTVGGQFQDPGNYYITLNGGGNSITFYTAPAAAAVIAVNQVAGVLNTVYNITTGVSVPLQGLCLSTYWAFGSLSPVQGFAADVCFYGDRLILAASTLQPQSLWTSKPGDYLNFGFSDPQVDSDAITETVNGRQQNPINQLLPLNNLILGTASASWRVTNSTGIGSLAPSNLDIVPQEYYGMQPVPAILTGKTVIHVQWGGRKLRAGQYNFYTDKFETTEITTFARQMFPAGTTCVREAYAPEPFGLIFCVRSDGVLCVCSYLPEQQVQAWGRYITAGRFEDVSVVPENGTFSVYVIVGRTLNGIYQRFIERFAAREFATPQDGYFVDCGLTYDGRNSSTSTMTVTGGTTWLAGDTGTLTASSASGWVGFNGLSGDPLGAIWLNDANGNRLCRLQITGHSSNTVATVKFLDPVPAAVQGVAVSTWTAAVSVYSGLNQLVGQTIAVQADGGTAASQVVGVGGLFTLPAAAGVVHAGLGYTCLVQGLPPTIPGQPSIRNRTKTINRLSVLVDQSGTYYAGSSNSATLVEAQIRDFEGYGQPQQLHTGMVNTLLLSGAPDDDASIIVQLTDPTPLTILGWMGDMTIGEAG